MVTVILKSGAPAPGKPTLQYIDPMLNPSGLRISSDDVIVSICDIGLSMITVIMISGVPAPGKPTLQCMDPKLNPSGLRVSSDDVIVSMSFL